MNAKLIGLLAETSIHPGAGQSSGVVDLPVAREAATDYPVVPGSSLKGALLSFVRHTGTDGKARISEGQRKTIFGAVETKSEDGKLEGGAGALLVSDARLLLLPVRSLHTASKWVTCPHLLERFTRDSQRAGSPVGVTTSSVSAGGYLGASNGALFLEERQFSHAGTIGADLLAALAPLIPHETTRARLKENLVVLQDDDFVWFARHGLAVQARNVLEETRKTSQNLWYEEAIPADALLYTLLTERQDGALDAVLDLFKDRPYLQVGGNETVGMGWFAVALPEAKGGAA